MNLADLKQGEKGIIKSFTDKELATKLMEMGCLPGEVITYERAAPMGDPIVVAVTGYFLSLRKSDAATVLIEEIISS